MTGFYLAVLSHPTGAPETFMVYLEVFMKIMIVISSMGPFSIIHIITIQRNSLLNRFTVCITHSFMFLFLHSLITSYLFSLFRLYTGWPKSYVSKVRAYCSASDHLICKIFSTVCWVSHWFKEYLKIIKMGDYFFE